MRYQLSCNNYGSFVGHMPDEVSFVENKRGLMSQAFDHTNQTDFRKERDSAYLGFTASLAASDRLQGQVLN